MSISLTPPPLTEDLDSPIWQQWYHSLYKSLSTAAGVAWAAVDKTGSSISSLASKAHSELTSVLGGGSYHLSQTQYDRTALLTAAATVPWSLITTATSSGAADPTTTDIPAGQWAVWKNTNTGTIKLWTNDGGVMKSVALV